MKRFVTVLAITLVLASTSDAQLSEERLPDKVDLLKGTIEFSAPVHDRKIVDGDTIWMGIHQLRLYGIDAVEPKQDCRIASVKVTCHEMTVSKIEKWVNEPDFSCVGFREKNGEPWMSYSRYNAICYLNGEELNRTLVETGWAFASNKSAGKYYEPFEDVAKSQKLGLHAMSLEKPWNWRNPDSENSCRCEEN